MKKLESLKGSKFENDRLDQKEMQSVNGGGVSGYYENTDPNYQCDFIQTDFCIEF